MITARHDGGMVIGGRGSHCGAGGSRWGLLADRRGRHVVLADRPRGAGAAARRAPARRPRRRCYDRPVPQPPAEEITRYLRAWEQGDDGALERLLPVVYAELRAITSRHLGSERPGHTLQPTALANEAYLRLR